MLSLKEHFRILEEDLISTPIRISAYHDLPFAIFRYDPQEEFTCRKHIRLLSISLEQNYHKKVHFVSLAKLLWRAIYETEGLDSVIAVEKRLGFEHAQEMVYRILSDEDFMPLPRLLEEEVRHLSPEKDIVFLVRAASLAPGIYRCSVLLDQMHGRTMVPMILFYPGTIDGKTDLRFMNMHERANSGTYNYRVKIYGGE